MTIADEAEGLPKEKRPKAPLLRVGWMYRRPKKEANMLQGVKNHRWGLHSPESLIADYLAGNEWAREDLAQSIATTLRRKLRMLSANPQETDDLVQDSVIAILEHVRDFRPETGNFEAWVGGFAHNCWRSHIRKQTRHRATFAPLDELDVASDSRQDQVYDAPLLQAMGTLDILDKELLHMKYTLGMTSDEIAGASDMNAPQVRKRISRAVERLRRHPAIQKLLTC